MFLFMKGVCWAAASIPGALFSSVTDTVECMYNCTYCICTKCPYMIMFFKSCPVGIRDRKKLSTVALPLKLVLNFILILCVF